MVVNPEIANTATHLMQFDSFRTSNLDEARNYTSSLFVPHQLDVIGSDYTLDFCTSVAQVDGVYLIYHRHGQFVRVKPQRLKDFYLLQIPIRGNALVSIGNDEIHCDPRHAVMLCPDEDFNMQFTPDCEQLIVRVDRSEFERYLSAHFGYASDTQLRFTPCIPLNAAPARELLDLLQFMTRTLSSPLGPSGLGGSQLARRQLASLMVSAMVACLEHNFHDALKEAEQRRATPACINMAMEFIRANLGEAFSPEDVAAAANVSTRALFSAFKKHLNTTPMRYVKNLRLDLVHATLLEMKPYEVSVTSVAMNFGFQHLGHFSAAYKRKFGVLPYHTLQQ